MSTIIRTPASISTASATETALAFPCKQELQKSGEQRHGRYGYCRDRDSGNSDSLHKACPMQGQHRSGNNDKYIFPAALKPDCFRRAARIFLLPPKRIQPSRKSAPGTKLIPFFPICPQSQRETPPYAPAGWYSIVFSLPAS